MLEVTPGPYRLPVGRRGYRSPHERPHPTARPQPARPARAPISPTTRAARAATASASRRRASACARWRATRNTIRQIGRADRPRPIHGVVVVALGAWGPVTASLAQGDHPADVGGDRPGQHAADRRQQVLGRVGDRRGALELADMTIAVAQPPPRQTARTSTAAPAHDHSNRRRVRGASTPGRRGTARRRAARRG